MLVALTKEQAQEIVSAHEIELLDGDEETELLEANNPELAEAYRALLAMADA